MNKRGQQDQSPPVLRPSPRPCLPLPTKSLVVSNPFPKRARCCVILLTELIFAPTARAHQVKLFFSLKFPPRTGLSFYHVSSLLAPFVRRPSTRSTSPAFPPAPSPFSGPRIGGLWPDHVEIYRLSILSYEKGPFWTSLLTPVPPFVSLIYAKHRHFFSPPARFGLNNFPVAQARSLRLGLRSDIFSTSDCTINPMKWLFFPP